jgi:predicted dithiol-disulfide oxidoreductase (DUF899 family)
MIKKSFPKVVSQSEWQKAREVLLKEEKEATRMLDALAAKRRRLPMVQINKEYLFEGQDGKVSLHDLFNNCSQLIVYHFMFAPAWVEGCVGCSKVTDSMGNLAHLKARDTSLVLVSRAPYTKIEPFKNRMGWAYPWYSSFESDFDYDFQAAEYETPRLSVFFRNDGKIHLAYTTFGRGVDRLMSSLNYLDLTPFGRQEEWEDSPEGWPKIPGFWWRHHDKYDD